MTPFVNQGTQLLVLFLLCLFVTLDGFSLGPSPVSSRDNHFSHNACSQGIPRHLQRCQILHAKCHLENALSISSLTNDFVKRMVKLRDQDGELRNLVLLEEEDGKPWHQGFLDELNTAGMKNVYVVTKGVFKKIVGVESADGRQAAAEISMPEQASMRGLNRVVVLDRIQDPGNVGTLLRTAAGLGWEGVWLLDGTCDPFNDKTLRAAKGACWRLNMRQGGMEELEELVGAAAGGERGCEVLVADMFGEPPTSKASHDGARFLVLSNEGAGVSRAVRERLDDESDLVWQGVGVQLVGGVESLNVAVAGGILMYALS